MQGSSENVTPMLLLQLIVLTLFAFPQVAAIPDLAEGVLNAKEKQNLAREDNVEKRIKIYESASKRIQKTLRGYVSDGDFSEVPETLKLWNSLLSASLKDIEANLKTKKKSRPLIRFEIQVRKAIADLRDYQTKAPLDQQNAFDSCLAQAEKVHQRFVDIIFKH
jgi:hypothetical protein